MSMKMQWDEMNESKRGGSVVGRIYIERDTQEGHQNLMGDYFNEAPRYPELTFRRRFRMRKPLFLRIVEGIKDHDSFFLQKVDAAGKIGPSTLQKATAVIRQLSYGCSADATDEYIRIGESSALQCMKRFCRAVVEVFREEYLRSPNEEDINRLLQEGDQRGFPGMLGSLDCMHWGWKNCPTAWQGVYTGKGKAPTVVLEAVASHDLWIWHAFFGLPGSMNDINILDHSHLFRSIYQQEGPQVHYEINGHEYKQGYYLADGIYPSYATLVKTFSQPQGAKQKVIISLMMD
jgi:hypothetical protein